ncbi:velvet factor-domain-containing protein [Paraphysoderma sedebokerense]|nr:velvet factor-domain-containing protein [Paraphysoderma sedebokerense]
MNPNFLRTEVLVDGRVFTFSIRQNCVHSRSCGYSERIDRRPLDPPPIIQLQVHLLQKNGLVKDRSYLYNPYFFVYATLVDQTGASLPIRSNKKVSPAAGSVVSSLYRLVDINREEAAFFVFPDLSIRTEGAYRLRFSLYELRGSEFKYYCSVLSDIFSVYSAKRFPGMAESTDLSKLFADQGLKIRIRRETRVLKRQRMDSNELSEPSFNTNSASTAIVSSRDSPPMSPKPPESSSHMNYAKTSQFQQPYYIPPPENVAPIHRTTTSAARTNFQNPQSTSHAYTHISQPANDNKVSYSTYQPPFRSTERRSSPMSYPPFSSVPPTTAADFPPPPVSTGFKFHNLDGVIRLPQLYDPLPSVAKGRQEKSFRISHPPHSFPSAMDRMQLPHHRVTLQKPVMTAAPSGLPLIRYYDDDVRFKQHVMSNRTIETVNSRDGETKDRIQIDRLLN